MSRPSTEVALVAAALLLLSCGAKKLSIERLPVIVVLENSVELSVTGVVDSRAIFHIINAGHYPLTIHEIDHEDRTTFSLSFRDLPWTLSFFERAAVTVAARASELGDRACKRDTVTISSNSVTRETLTVPVVACRASHQR